MADRFSRRRAPSSDDSPGSPGSHPPPATFDRDAETTLAYGALNCFAFWLYAFGPALALLRDQLDFSYTLLGVYAAVWSAGSAVTGLAYPRLARSVPRLVLLWTSSLSASAGLAVFVLGRTVPVTLAGAAVAGVAGSAMLTVTQAMLSSRHGDRRDRALTEANVIAGVCAVLAPLLLGALAGAPGGWRTVFVLPMLMLSALFLRYRGLPLSGDDPRPEPDLGERVRHRRRLPVAARLFVTLVALTVAVEFCMVYFGAEQLRDTGLTTAAAATAMSGYYLGLLLGRVAGAVATARPGRVVLVLQASLALTLVGFVVFWLVGSPLVAILGLVLTGAGTANLYPLTLALALGAAPGQQDQANAGTQLLGGVLVAASPYLLGRLADHLDLTTAFAVEPVLIGLCLVCLVAGTRLDARPASRPGGR